MFGEDGEKMNDHLFRQGLGLPTKTIFDDYDVPWGYYAYVIREDDLVRDLYFFNVIDEEIEVFTTTPDRVNHPWSKQWRGEYLVFSPPDVYKGEGDLIGIHSHPWIQRFIPAPRLVLEKFALGNRTSVNF